MGESLNPQPGMLERIIYNRKLLVVKSLADLSNRLLGFYMVTPTIRARKLVTAWLKIQYTEKVVLIRIAQ